METGFLAPSPSNLKAIAKANPDKPVHMLNFLKFKERAEYAADHEHADNGWNGQRAYLQYSTEFAGPIARAEAKIVWQNTVHGTIIGPDGEQWDAIFVVEYPNVSAFQTMVSDPEYLAGAPNRSAALADSRLFLTQPPEA